MKATVKGILGYDLKIKPVPIVIGVFCAESIAIMLGIGKTGYNATMDFSIVLLSLSLAELAVHSLGLEDPAIKKGDSNE